jgi:serine/threonine-protein kinase RsbW
MNGKQSAPCVFQSEDLLVKLDIMIPGTASSVLPVVQRIMYVVNEMNCAAGREFEIEQALIEALNNAIEHGCSNDPSKKVQCCVACDQARGMLIVVRDEGPGFDPSSIPNPTLGQNIFFDGGRGIYLINQLVDEIHFEKGGTEIHMRMHPPNIAGKKDSE